MTQTRRLSGGLINRQRPLNFEFDGKKLFGYQGDTLASALLANGVQLMGRSFKYHRPRGPFTSGSEEPNAIVELREAYLLLLIDKIINQKIDHQRVALNARLLLVGF